MKPFLFAVRFTAKCFNSLEIVDYLTLSNLWTGGRGSRLSYGLSSHQKGFLTISVHEYTGYIFSEVNLGFWLEFNIKLSLVSRPLILIWNGSIIMFASILRHYFYISIFYSSILSRARGTVSLIVGSLIKHLFIQIFIYNSNFVASSIWIHIRKPNTCQ